MTALAIGGIASRVLSSTPGHRKERPFTDPVRKHSIHEDRPEAKPWRIFGRRSRAEKRAYVIAVLDAFETALVESKRKAAMLRREKRHRIEILAASGRGPDHPYASRMVIEQPLQDGDRRVLAFLLDIHNHRTGECYPTIDTIAEEIARSREAVNDSLARLKERGFVRWIRRTKTKPGSEGEAGPQLEQTSNAYTFDWERSLVGRALMVFRDVLRRCLKRITPPAPAKPQEITDPALKAATESLRASVRAKTPPPPDDSANGK
jgi:hypothetical protein